jgi:CO/xanthine dehydrogenase FAD-binding subunit
MPAFSYQKSINLSEATGLLAKQERIKPLAGGTDLIVGVRGGKFNVEAVLDIKEIPEMKVLLEDMRGITIGAAITLNEIVNFAPVREHLPVLAQGCHSIGTYSVRNRATLVGNICNASPAADTAGPLYCLGALVNIAGARSSRSVPIDEFITGPGKTGLQAGELVLSVTILKPYPVGKGVYLKASRTGSVDLATVGVAVQKWGKEVRIALGAVAPTPIRAKSVEKAINQEGLNDWARAAEQVKNDISPITDLRGSREYRYHMAEVLVRRGLEQVMEV